ncbi:hypothetical protein [Mesorhizobium sp. M8A.F.Ca.ET.021.01.1.1]|uniref:hypothetical protein n=1 Tax=Mesorhizobium sp. M8A.F.Ca.ET.021.01.1.1 TaxID=2496757 RepID=UPI000FCA29DE|nr:hypothetical protein [Mesorhizobium sp. M8A.F.Ca.ET.021.01.1.1]RUW55820.1 hypothetical protein EOA36_07085 [Mesorhizobium sp. M8A.F.Ca.ET.021.01.1.1]
MNEAAALDIIADDMETIKSRFKRTNSGLHIGDGDQAAFIGLVLRARTIMKRALGVPNDFDFQLGMMQADGVNNWLGSQSYASVERSASIVRAAAQTVRDIPYSARPPLTASRPPAVEPYVAPGRLAELLAITGAKFDLRRLIRYCEEINDAYERENYFSVAMLLRAIADHVPPIFNVGSFRQYASSCGGQSLKGTMTHLDNSLRNIADGILHQQIRPREILPTASQVNFRQDLDVLLGEVVRALRP